MNCYVAQFTEDHSGIYHVSFPDLPGCLTFGKDMETALRQAMDALAGHLEVEEDLGASLPKASKLTDIQKGTDSKQSANTTWQLVCVEPKAVAPESITIWMHSGLFRMIKEYSNKKGLSISHFLEIAAGDYLQRAAAQEQEKIQNAETNN